MAQFDYSSGIAFGVQSGLGTINGTIRDLVDGGGSGPAGAIDETDGAVKGSSAAGIAEDGIDDEYTREYRDKAVVPGSFT